MQSDSASDCSASDPAISTAPGEDASEPSTFEEMELASNATESDDQSLEEAAAPARDAEFYIVGTWDGWASKHAMTWDGEHHLFELTLGCRGEEGFQILKGGDWQSKLHPDVADASPHAAHAVQGPSDSGHGLNWTVGRHWSDDGAPGKRYQIRLAVAGAVSKIDWVRLLTDKEKPAHGEAPAFSVVGTWDKWAAKHPMTFDGEHYFFDLKMGSAGEESIQILKDGDWEAKLHPDEEDASPYEHHNVKGPGDSGHGMNWTVGRHKVDAGAPGKRYTIRLTVEGAFHRVNWTQVLTDEDHKRAEKQRAEREKAAEGRAAWTEKEKAESAAQEEAEREAAKVGAKADEDALEEYCQRFAGPVLGEFAKGTFCWQVEGAAKPWGHDVRMQLEQELEGKATRAGSEEAFDSADDFDTMDTSLCCQCNLPVGEWVYEQQGGKVFHGECMAQRMLHGLREEREQKQKEETRLKEKCRVEYDLGWKADRAPRNVAAAKKLTGQSVRQGMCCLVLGEDSNKLCVAPTIEPATSVNLEYLSTALRVRLHDGREPLFSLDPVEAKRNAMQFKRFEPAWLAGTGVGEVLFQSDYHLKELSMGEYEQPVVGMKSCLDICMETTAGEWNAREWFIVRKAEIQLSQENVLIPYLRMGVEAREQIVGKHGLEDVKRNKPDHPLVKYAESFTHNFDLIAERKSVMYHLREVAKASVLAKFLVESEAEVSDAWFNLADGAKATCLEVPQLWNEMFRSQIQVEDGKIVDADKVSDPSKGRSVYGGVQFGLDKFNLAAPRAGLRASSMSIAAAIRQAPGRQGFARAAISATSRLAPSVFPSSLRTAAPMARAAISAQSRLAPSAFPSTLRTAAPMARAAISAQTRLAPSVFPSSLRTAAPMARAAISAQTRLAPSVFPSSLRTAAPMARAAISAQTRLAPSVFPSSLRTAAPMARAAISAQTRLAPSVFPSSLRTAAPMARAAISASTRLAPSVFPSSLRTAAPMARAAISASTRLAPSVFPSSLRTAAPMARAAISATTRMAPSVFPASLRSVAPGAPMARGVDLNLDNFDLSELKRVDLAGSVVDSDGLDACVAMGSAFWSSIDSTSVSLFKDEHKGLLKDIFNPCLTDRRGDGDRFVPPDTRAAYVEKLRDLVREEEMVRVLRKKHFFSTDFAPKDAGPLFPSSWKAAYEIAQASAQASLQIRPDYKAEAPVLARALKTVDPAFDKRAEDGTRFRVYRVGSLEVRTTQEHDGEEVVGAVFSTAAPQQGAGPQGGVQEQEKIVKVTQYIEHAAQDKPGSKQHRSYVVVETERGNTILTEQVKKGTVAWEENAKNLEVRNSVAKVLRSSECNDACVTVGNLMSYREWASNSQCKQYAAGAFRRARGDVV